MCSIIFFCSPTIQYTQHINRYRVVLPLLLVLYEIRNCKQVSVFTIWITYFETNLKTNNKKKQCWLILIRLMEILVVTNWNCLRNWSNRFLIYFLFDYSFIRWILKFKLKTVLITNIELRIFLSWPYFFHSSDYKADFYLT